MNILDIIVLIVLGVGIWQGGRNGFIKSLCSFAGFGVGLLFAYSFYKVVGDKLAPQLGENAQAAPIIAFILIWLVFPIALSIVSSILTKFVKILFLGKVNTVLGAVIGILKYFISTTLVVYAMVLMGVVSQETAYGSFFGNMMIAFVESFMRSYSEATMIAA